MFRSPEEQPQRLALCGGATASCAERSGDLADHPRWSD
jgi:hypothetical protein